MIGCSRDKFSPATYENTFVLYDFETESLWYHLLATNCLTCVEGEYADRKLEEFEAVEIRWLNWKKIHPETHYYNPDLQ